MTAICVNHLDNVACYKNTFTVGCSHEFLCIYLFIIHFLQVAHWQIRAGRPKGSSSAFNKNLKQKQV